MPVTLAGESRSTTRKIHCGAPSMPAGTIVWVKVHDKWIKPCVQRIEFAVLVLQPCFDT